MNIASHDTYGNYAVEIQTYVGIFLGTVLGDAWYTAAGMQTSARERLSEVSG